MSELADLQLDQYQRRTLKNIQRKGDEVTASIPLSKDTCEALADYLSEERPKGPGPLFQSRAGKPLAQQDVDYILRSIAAQANSRLSASEHIQVSPHVLRHTALRKWANTKGIRFAQKIAGHSSERYIWRYVTPSEDEVQDAVDDLWQ